MFTEGKCDLYLWLSDLEISTVHLLLKCNRLNTFSEPKPKSVFVNNWKHFYTKSHSDFDLITLKLFDITKINSKFGKLAKVFTLLLTGNCFTKRHSDLDI